MNINHLPDDCLWHILKQCTISLQELLQLSSVCTRWHSIVALICRSRQSLKLFGSPNRLTNYCDDLVRYNIQHDDRFQLRPIGLDDELSVHSAIDLPETFPNVLELVINCESPIEVPKLLCQWTNLQTLALFGKPSKRDLTSIWASISSLKCLKQLHLFGLYLTTIPDQSLQSLEHFSLTGHLGSIVPVLAKLGPRLSHLWLEHITCTADQLEQSIKLNRHLPQSLTHLTLGWLFSGFSGYENHIENITQVLSCVYAHLRQLIYLDLMFSYFYIPLGDILTNLNKLSALSELHLELDSMVTNIDAGRHRSLRPLQSIGKLHLKIAGRKVVPLLLSIGWLFPAVYQLTIVCQYEVYMTGQVHDCLTASGCFRQLKHSIVLMNDTVVDRSPNIGRNWMNSLRYAQTDRGRLSGDKTGGNETRSLST